MKKISLLKSLALLGAVGLTSVCVIETALLMNKKSGQEVDTIIDLDTYNNYTLVTTVEYDEMPSSEWIRNELKIGGIQRNSEELFKFADKEDLLITVNPSPVEKTFSVSTLPNSSYYVEGSSAIMHYATPTRTNIASIIGSNPVAYLDDKFEDEELTKSNILTSLKNSFPALNINHLNISLNDLYGQEGNATISVKEDSRLYVGDPIGITYNTSGSVTMTLDKNVIDQGQTATPTFKYHGITVSTGVTYSCSAPSANFSFVTGTGVLTYTSGNTADFFGGAYSINASYTTDGNTYTASQIVFAQSNIQTGTLSLAAPNISSSNLNSGTATFKVNGATVTTNLGWAISPAVPTGQGLSFASGKLTWDGTTNTAGGIYTITCTRSGTGIKTAIASALVFVSQSHIIKDIGFTIASGWVLERNLTHYDAITRLLTIDLVIHINGYSYSVANYQVGTFSSLPTSFTRQNLVNGWMTYGDMLVLSWTEGSNKLVARPTGAYTSNNAQLYLSATFYL